MANPDSKLFIGLMSGTSADGIDSALVHIDDAHIELIEFATYPLSTALKDQLLKLNQNCEISLETLCQLQYSVANEFAAATQTLLKQNRLDKSDICAIGSHGQTIYHAPHIPMTLQIGHPAIIAKQTGIQVAGDFRVDDMALGGQGAPFAPAFHQALFSQMHDTFVVNIGGIANISFLPGMNNHQPIIGWDCGPGNCLMDELSQREFAQSYDADGAIAQQGRVNSALLTLCLADSYFAQNYPKSTGRDLFNWQWLQHKLDQLDRISNLDIMATLAELTAKTISQDIERLPSDRTGNIIISGGGAYNPYLMARLQQFLPSFKVISSDQLDIAADAIEAMMCAWLAQQRIELQSVPLASVTGAQRNAVLGGLWHP
ncbi:anhydro-N-acetylmuramic acid kinase [Thiomicrorhabdus sediminis]|uniref:Anhydro-N-acetylmuramic acid kinase n=1 Tax=Thiomicrorhabdus sediminis TaxID=2580412 RepID=A0A4P9K3J0_9GAMM|nr:anhydro-N-acetylmuramic acid kinase [Thiomicrorhabdus sediminis]QCU89474.1 anhydro-N-acetylmuramic acid kinase [Thiomicrorhabdus sediminis]